ncbi:GerMN domain-containing protein [Paenibacillus sp. TRM 82003]|uniref:Gmad2 immunoglobulin-like domain-containing protein n=1 Tax=Kineococcus sp. TRM81007 TaxID=2925831 RepID=UPI001F5A271B|nr:Gmad2 immunoglobulin-like domain-containing protein [Kineococcus sp. TRM81007]MCI2240099.1 GerMN domain-containing protein [Kineococcus sp. TRM81007]MCI3925595.1 GerMN domain-containing protein [Paenibacillus sp. TRM 82003]
MSDRPDPDDPAPAGPLPDPDTDPTARALRDALAARADAVQPTERLQEIRMSTNASRRSTRAWAAVATAAAVVVVGGSAFALTRGDGAVRTVASASTGTTQQGTTSPSPAQDATTGAPAEGTTGATTPPEAASTSDPGTPAAGTGQALPAGSATVPVYWLGGDPQLLFREYVPAGDAADDATNALRAVLGGQPSDPDYASPWGPDASATVTAGEDRLVVDIAASAASGDAKAGDVTAAVQQLVYTVTAAAGEDVPVEIRVDGRSEPLVFGYALPETVSRAPQADVQAPAWITSVDTGTPGQVVVEGVGSAFEGTLLYTVTDASGAEVTRGPAQAGANGTFAEFSVTIPLPAGEYTVLVERPDESGGEAGAQPAGDTKSFTVR